MPNLSISLPHAFDRAEAKKRTQECIAQFQRQYGSRLGHLDERWNGDTMDFTFVAMGMPISGKAYVEDRAVRVEVELPWILSTLAGGMKKSIEHEGRKALSAPK